jgi:hypothetical protein
MLVRFVKNESAPLDVMWMRISHRARDLEQRFGDLPGPTLVLIS